MKIFTDDFSLDPYDEIPPTPKSAIKTSPKHRRMLTIYGKDKENRTCKGCDYLVKRQYSQAHYKCTLSGETSSTASDWRLKWDACRKYKESDT